MDASTLSAPEFMKKIRSIDGGVTERIFSAALIRES
jgi:hypothetical protein